MALKGVFVRSGDESATKYDQHLGATKPAPEKGRAQDPEGKMVTS